MLGLGGGKVAWFGAGSASFGGARLSSMKVCWRSWETL